ncbi:MAG: undecaprenyl-phosphate glucose phosphotransferase [Tannerella sp.]|jgi:putative colanic acid biosynthesis UDP-glucose lipid carrier transferase|nr:undecaprenyl-phosphate glucose phosphotransferase [Tannerella sp.]
MEQKNRQVEFLQWIIGTGDLLILNILFFALYHKMKEFTGINLYNLKEIFLILNFCYFFALYFVPIQLHRSVVYLEKIVQRSFTLITIQTILFATCIDFLKQGSSLFTFFIIYYIVMALSFTIWRVLIRVAIKEYRRKGYNSKNIIIVGAGKNGMELFRVIKTDLSYGFNVLGFFDDNDRLKDILPNYLGRIDELGAFAATNEIDEIYCTIPGYNSEKISDLLLFAEKNMIRFYIIPEFYRNVKKSMVLDFLESVPLLSPRNEPLQSPYNRFLKRTFDVVFSLIVLFVFYPPLYLIAGALIKFSSKGPILFKQKRTGIYGQVFECYKFRTMKMNQDADIVQAVKDDPRTTRIGSFLRRTNLDEFPQFVNVLLGDMSVVGPRPHMLKHTELYSKLIDKYMVRHLVKPGITGWAQIMGYRGETRTLEQMEGRVKRDVWYLENWSFFLDLKIIFVTIVNMFQGEKNAY